MCLITMTNRDADSGHKLAADLLFGGQNDEASPSMATGCRFALGNFQPKLAVLRALQTLDTLLFQKQPSMTSAQHF